MTDLTVVFLSSPQVLENRTHPVLQMSGGGGYLLSGTTVEVQPSRATSKPAGAQKAGEPEPKRLKLTETEG